MRKFTNLSLTLYGHRNICTLKLTNQNTLNIGYHVLIGRFSITNTKLILENIM